VASPDELKDVPLTVKRLWPRVREVRTPIDKTREHITHESLSRTVSCTDDELILEGPARWTSRPMESLSRASMRLPS
jgi:hypothetical protein